MQPPKSTLLSLVLLALCRQLLDVSFSMKLIAALVWLKAIMILFFPTTTFVQFLGLLEDLIKIKLSDNVLLVMEK